MTELSKSLIEKGRKMDELMVAYILRETLQVIYLKMLILSISYFVRINRYTRAYQLSRLCYIESTMNSLYEPHHEKTFLCHMRTTKAQISLRICAV